MRRAYAKGQKDHTQDAAKDEPKATEGTTPESIVQELDARLLHELEPGDE